jgi:hypothetical protein
MPLLRGRRKRQVVTALVVAACIGLFTLQWHQAPRVETSPAVLRQLPSARGELYLGKNFEGLPLRTVDPFLYSDCEPGKKKQTPVPCDWVKVTDGRVTGADPKQVARARAELRRVR